MEKHLHKNYLRYVLLYCGIFNRTVVFLVGSATNKNPIFIYQIFNTQLGKRSVCVSSLYIIELNLLLTPAKNEKNTNLHSLSLCHIVFLNHVNCIPVKIGQFPLFRFWLGIFFFEDSSCFLTTRCPNKCFGHGNLWSDTRVI